MRNIQHLREKIEKIDRKIVLNLAEREAVAIQIGKLKSKHGLAIIDKAQEEKLFIELEKLAIQHHLDPDFVKKIFTIIILHSRSVQKF